MIGVNDRSVSLSCRHIGLCCAAVLGAAGVLGGCAASAAEDVGVYRGGEGVLHAACMDFEKSQVAWDRTKAAGLRSIKTSPVVASFRPFSLDDDTLSRYCAERNMDSRGIGARYAWLLSKDGKSFRASLFKAPKGDVLGGAAVLDEDGVPMDGSDSTSFGSGGGSYSVSGLEWWSKNAFGDNYAHNDGSLNQWQKNYYVAHRSSSYYGPLIASLQPGDIITVNGQRIQITGSTYGYTGEYYTDVRNRIGWDTVAFQTCTTGDGNIIVYGKPIDGSSADSYGDYASRYLGGSSSSSSSGRSSSSAGGSSSSSSASSSSKKPSSSSSSSSSSSGSPSGSSSGGKTYSEAGVELGGPSGKTDSPSQSDSKASGASESSSSGSGSSDGGSTAPTASEPSPEPTPAPSPASDASAGDGAAASNEGATSSPESSSAKADAAE